MNRGFRQLICTLLLCTLLCPVALAAAFTTVRVDGIEDFGVYYKRLRYADDQTPIPLSLCDWNGSLYATIPAENAGRPVEVFSVQEIIDQ